MDYLQGRYLSAMTGARSRGPEQFMIPNLPVDMQLRQMNTSKHTGTCAGFNPSHAGFSSHVSFVL